MSTYRLPAQKKPSTANFCGRFSWSFHTIGAGMISRMTLARRVSAASEINHW